MAVYPRACGGTRRPRPIPACRPGLSPRLRGNRMGMARWQTAARFIPAPAGEPPPIRGQNRYIRVYPRACGGTFGFNTSG